MNDLLELHDSTLASIDTVDGDVVVRLAPGYVHHSGSGWLQDIDFIIRDGIVRSLPLLMPCWLADGSLTIDGTHWDNVIPLPLTASDALTFSAVTENSENLLIVGNGAVTVSHGELRFVELLPW